MLIRAATAADLPAVEAVRLGTWQVAYRGIVPDAFLDGLEVRPETVAWLAERLESGDVRTHVAELDGEIVGMASHGPCRDDDLLGVPELYALYVLSSRWGTGVGAQLLEACGRLETLWVLEGNVRARAFYERHGFRPDGTRKHLDRVEVAEVRYRLA